MRIALGVEYYGRELSGWETQPGRPTVQASLERALSRVADHRVRTTCAGRTDAGVHATAQVVHFDTSASRPLRSWVFGTNSNLREAVSVIWAHAVEETFHARYSACSRHYRYVILNRPVRPGLLNGRVAWDYRPLDAQRMQAAARWLLGEHDFSAFRAAGCQAKTAVRTVHRIDVLRRGDLVVTDVIANAFLLHMVRNILGALVAVGANEREPVWVRDLLESRDRTRGGVTMPADGLYLVDVSYPSEFGLPRVSPPSALW